MYFNVYLLSPASTGPGVWRYGFVVEGGGRCYNMNWLCLCSIPWMEVARCAEFHLFYLPWSIFHYVLTCKSVCLLLSSWVTNLTLNLWLSNIHSYIFQVTVVNHAISGCVSWLCHTLMRDNRHWVVHIWPSTPTFLYFHYLNNHISATL